MLRRTLHRLFPRVYFPQIVGVMTDEEKQRAAVLIKKIDDSTERLNNARRAVNEAIHQHNIIGDEHAILTNNTMKEIFHPVAKRLGLDAINYDYTVHVGTGEITAVGVSSPESIKSKQNDYKD